MTGGTHLSGRTKIWAETVLALILGRDIALAIYIFQVHLLSPEHDHKRPQDHGRNMLHCVNIQVYMR
jgi:hypothetical protein